MFPPPRIFLLLLLTGSVLHAEPVSYTREVRPILSENCFYCHGQDGNQRKADLQLNTLKGQRDSGAVVPGKPDESELVKRLFSSDPEEVMPPPKSNRHVSAAQRELLKRWVAEGASFEEHWTFQAPVRPAVPIDEANPVDAFVGEKMKENALGFSPEADRATLLRRLALDLTGLQPTAAEVDRFLADTATDAYEKQVERLLASPHFGERFSLPWLDAARFADSNGFQQDGDTHQYIWRDWVVRALNNDMPFDQFSIEQLAGDLLPEPTEDQLVATAFNRNHLLNGEGGNIAEEQRNVILFDRVDTTATNWLGLTMACAQCHDHKYDPMTQRDYYSLMALFNNVPEKGTPGGDGQYRVADPWIAIGDAEEKKKLKDLQKALAAAKKSEADIASSPETDTYFVGLEKELVAQAPVEWKVARPKQMQATDGVELVALDDQSIYSQGSLPDKTNYQITLPHLHSTITGLRIETIPDSRLPNKGAGRSDSGNAVLTSLKLSVGDQPISLTKASATFSQGGFSPEGVIDEDVNTGWAFYPDTNKPYTLAVQCAEAVHVPPDKELTLTMEFQSGHKQHLLGRFRVSLSSSAQPAVRTPLPDEIAAILKKSERNGTEKKKLRDYLLKERAPDALMKARQQTATSEKAHNEYRNAFARVMVMSDAQPRKTHILLRGEYLNPGEEVKVETPAFLPPMPEGAPKNRLGFAQWLFMPTHPLTARVQVNRVWQYFFGTGLIKTTEDLGVQSEVPVHNALLDFLAVEFRENGWSQKKLIRLILTSRTYRQSSKISSEQLLKDPENRLLARASRFRMPSMLLRDMALSASGLLNLKLGGKPVYPYQPEAVWETLAITTERDFTYPASHGEELYRRSLYTFWRRTVGPVNMFDASARQACKVRSAQTSTPLHALTTLNDVTWVEAARVLAEKALATAPERSAQLSFALRQVLSRAATDADLKFLNAAFEKQHVFFTADLKAAEEFVKAGEAAQNAALPAVDHAAMAAICLALFNLDEALTRE